MSGAVMEATAIINAKDNTGPALDALAKRMQAIIRLSGMMNQGARMRTMEASLDAVVSKSERAQQSFERLAQAERTLGRAEGLERVGRQLDRAATNARRLDDGLARAHTRAERLGHSLGTIGQLAGPVILRGAEAATKSGAEYQHAVVGLRQAGVPEAEIARIQTEAYAIARSTPSLTAAQIIEMHKEVRSAVRHPDEAFEVMPDLAKAKAIMQANGVADANFGDIVKGAESLGLMGDLTRFRAYLEGQVKAINVMGHTISTEQIYEAAKYSKAAGAGLSDRFLNLVMPSLIQEMHGSSAGDALAMVTKSLRGGLANKHLAVETLNDLGLLADPSQVIRTKTGSIKGYKGKVVGDDLLSSDPDRWFTEVFKPRAEAHGITKLTDQIMLLSKIMPQTAANLGRIVIQQEETLNAHRQNYETAPGLDKAFENTNKDASAQLKSLTSAIETFTGALASPAMERAASIMHGLATTFTGWADGISKFTKANPELAANVGGLGLLGGAAVGGKLTYNLASGILGGFGLKGSAEALTHAAHRLDAAAGHIGGKTPGNARSPSSPFTLGRLLTGVSFAWLLGNAVKQAAEDVAKGKGLDPSKHPGAVAKEVVANGIAEAIVEGSNAAGVSPDRIADNIQARLDENRRKARAAALDDLVNRAPGVVPPTHLDFADIERARRAQEDLIRDPEGTRGRHMMERDHNLDLAQAISAALTGKIDVTFKAEAGPELRAVITSIVKQEMSAIEVKGSESIGSTGATHHGRGDL